MSVCLRPCFFSNGTNDAFSECFLRLFMKYFLTWVLNLNAPSGWDLQLFAAIFVSVFLCPKQQFVQKHTPQLFVDQPSVVYF